MADPVAAQKEPYMVSVEAGNKYFWCACGQSQKQPFCDGSHKGTEFTPLMYEAEDTKPLWFCGCKRSEKKPFCDGTHATL